MSETAAQPLPPPMPTQQIESPRAPRSWVGQVMLQTVGRAGAKVGLAWIILVAFCAVFAPLLANSYPILIKLDNEWSSPLVRNLTAVDWTLLIGAVAAAVLWSIRLSPSPAPRLSPSPGTPGEGRGEGSSAETKQRDVRNEALTLTLSRSTGRGDRIKRLRVPILLGIMASTLIVALFLVKPFKAHVYDEYRVAQTDGRVQWVLRAPIPYSPSDRLRDQFDISRPHPWAPSREHLLGTEVNGADILSNMIHACRIAMSVGFISTGIALMIGILIGGLMGYFVGLVDLLGMRLVEIVAAIPTIYLLLTFVAYYDRNIYMIMAIIGLTGWVGDARFVRAEFLKLRHQDFVQAAIAAGLPLRSVLFRHLLPNALAPLLVSASFGVASAILAESTLSFLGLGLVDEPSWGRLLDMARGAGGGFYWWLALFPGLAIFLTVLAYNLVGEALRDALDPRLRGAK